MPREDQGRIRIQSYLKMSAAALRGKGCMVYVLPDPVCPYAKQVACMHV